MNPTESQGLWKSDCVLTSISPLKETETATRGPEILCPCVDCHWDRRTDALGTRGANTLSSIPELLPYPHARPESMKKSVFPLTQRYLFNRSCVSSQDFCESSKDHLKAELIITIGFLDEQGQSVRPVEQGGRFLTLHTEGEAE